MTTRTRPLGLTAGTLVGGAWLVATALSQHPSRSFDRLRRYDPANVLLPNWRFFAPNPATHDNRLAYRILWADEEVSPWRSTHEIQGRTWRDPLWCPHRRRDKAITDMCSNLLTHLSDRRYARIEDTPTYTMMRTVVRHLVEADATREERRAQGFQFLVVRDTGYDVEGEVELIFASRFEALAPDLGAPAGPRAGVAA